MIHCNKGLNPRKRMWHSTKPNTCLDQNVFQSCSKNLRVFIGKWEPGPCVLLVIIGLELHF